MPLIKRLPLNEKGRDLIVGDVHGHFDALEGLMSHVGFDPLADRLIAVGDLVDRGPDSDTVLSWIDRPWFHSVLGNHELMTIAGQDDEEQRAMHFANGGAWFTGMTPNERFDYAQAFATLPVAIEIQTKAGPVGVVHADVPPGMAWPELAQRLDAGERDFAWHMLWSRSRIDAWARGQQTAAVPGIERLFVGHTPLKTPMVLENVYFLDGGHCFGGALHMADATQGEIIASATWTQEPSSHAD